MRRVITACFLLLISVLLHGITAMRTSDITDFSDPLLVSTECGPVQGAWIDVPAAEAALRDNDPASLPASTRVAVFRSIPYAAPPTAALRWTPPQAPKCWDGTLNATEFRGFCVQSVGIGDEDCLYLHVYVPEAVTTRLEAERQKQRQMEPLAHHHHKHSSRSPAVRGAPVLFYIHGGSLVAGSGNFEPLAPFAAHAGADAEGVVVVAINYRLNVFGYLAVRELSESVGPGQPAANWGLQDQQAALRWVQRNIAAFGGDPSRVTVAGQSSGGTSIFGLYSSIQSRGLFAGAISLSGSINVSMSIEQGWVQNAGMPAAAGCANSSVPSAVMDCMRNASIASLLGAIPESWSTPGMWGLELLHPGGMREYGGLILVDGVSVAAGFGTALARGLVDVPLILGNCGQEGDLAPDVDMNLFSQAQWGQYLTAAVREWNSSSLAPALLKLYGRPDENGNPTTRPEWASQSLITDYGLTCGTVQLALGAKIGNFSSSLYTFVNQWPPSSPVLVGLHEAYDAFHTSDYNALIEAWPSKLSWAGPQAQDLALSSLLQRIFYSFMRSGGTVESSYAGVEWGLFDAAEGFPDHSNTFVFAPNNASATQQDYKSGTCALLSEYGFGQTFWWVD